MKFASNFFQVNTYSEAISFIFRQLPMYQRIGGKAMKKGLANITQFCQALGNPHQDFPSIHVGGTNGKGSVSSMLASILMAQGLKVGLYTSPHLRTFRERIRINGEPISKADVVTFLNHHQAIIESLQPSFFELSVGMAFAHFATSKVDIAIIEVGLGGTKDSTNIIQPILSIITNISLDHENALGHSLGEIATHKAGIIKPQVPVVIGATHPETKDVFTETAASQGAPITFADQQFQVVSNKPSPNGQQVTVQDKRSVLSTFDLDLAGTYQQQNLLTVLAAVRLLPSLNLPLTKDAIISGLQSVGASTGLSGRWHRLSEQPLIYCDTAHNEAGVTQVMAQVTQIPHNILHIVWGVVADKTLTRILPLLPASAQYYFVKPAVPRGLSADLLAKQALDFGLKGKAYASVNQGLNAMRAAMGSDDLGFVGGSTFVVAEVVDGETDEVI